LLITHLTSHPLPVSLSLSLSTVPPSSKTKPKHLTLTAGSSQLYLHMQPEGSPPPSLQWYRNGLMLPHERKNILVATEVNRSHEGTYSCRLTNMAGTFTWLEATVEIRTVATSMPRLPSSASPPPPRGTNPPTTTVPVPAVPSHHQQKKKEQQREGL
jgi:glycogen debranching enzyme